MGSKCRGGGGAGEFPAHPQAPFLHPAPFQVAQGSHSAPINASNSNWAERKRPASTKPNACSFGKARTNRGDTRRGWLEQGTRSAYGFAMLFQERKGPLGSPEPLLSVKRLSVSSLLPLHKTRGCQDPQSRESCSSRSWVSPSEPHFGKLR